MNKALSFLLPIPFIAAFLLSGCFATTGTSQQPVNNLGPNGEPTWISNPQIMGDIVGLGYAKMHIQGPAMQRQLAISRALDEIARQKGVSVSNVIITGQSASGTGIKSSAVMSSEQTVDQQVVNAVIQEEWKNGDVLYILMVAQ